MKILPIPKQIEAGNSYLLDKKITVMNNDFSSNLSKKIQKLIHPSSDGKTNLIIQRNAELKEQEYALEINETQITINASSDVGAYYGLITLSQILQNEHIPTLRIKDFPDLEIRGVMLDISRSKVLNKKTLKYLIDMFSLLKINHLQLYVEGFSFEYKSFPDVLDEKNYITLNDYLEIEEYARQNYIDFVPNQNGFGHMEEWLKKDKYKYLAEIEEGFTIWGAHRAPSTLDPTNEKSVEHVKKMYQDMIPYTKSKYFNMNFDEPYELGYGNSKEAVQNSSLEDVYIKYFKQLYDEVKLYNKTPMLWGDVLIKHPDKIKELPKDAIFIDWGYNKNYQFEEHAKILQNLGVQYLFAPGTVTWSSITGRYIDMTTTIYESAINAKKYGGKGILVTDWGDIGHLQYLPSSYLGFIYSALISWNECSIDDAKAYLEKVLNDKNLTDVIIGLSKYHELEGEYRDYGSRLFSPIIWSEHARNQKEPLQFFKEKIKLNFISDENIIQLQKYFEKYQTLLLEAKESLEKEEIQNSLNCLEILLSLNIKFQLMQNDNVSFDEEILRLQTYLTEHKRLWFVRNIKQGYLKSANRIKWLIENLIKLNRKENV